LTTAHPRPSAHPAVDRWYGGARLANAVLGLWLFTSAFLWRHFDASLHNTWLVGALIFGSALAALRHTAWRWANIALSGWLFVSTLLLFRPLDTRTMWNNLLVAVLVSALSLIARPGRSGPRLRVLEGGRHS
jgi:hypothetical protein